MSSTALQAKVVHLEKKVSMLSDEVEMLRKDVPLSAFTEGLRNASPEDLKDFLDLLHKIAPSMGSVVSGGKASGKAKGGRGKKAKESSDSEDSTSTTSSEKKKREAKPEFVDAANARIAKAKEIVQQDIERLMEEGLSEAEAKKQAIKYQAALGEASIFERMARDGCTEEEARAKQAEDKAKREAAKEKKKAKEEGTYVAPPKPKSAPKPKASPAAPKAAPKAETEDEGDVSSVLSASNSKAPAKPAAKAAAKPAAEKPASKPAAKAAAKPAATESKSNAAPKAEDELVEGETAAMAKAQKKMGRERKLIDGKFYYIDAESNEAFDLKGEEAGTYDAEADVVRA